MRKSLTLAATAAALALTAAPALAHPAPFTVSAGTATGGTTIPFHGVAASISFKDTTTGVTLTCKQVSVPSDNSAGATKLTVGSTGGNPITDLDAAGSTWSNCTGPAGLAFTVTGVGTWKLHVTDVTSGVATGYIDNIRAHVVSTSPVCAFDAGSNTSTSGFLSSGTSTIDPATVNGTYTNSSQQLNVPGATSELGLWNVVGSGGASYCISPAILNLGDQASFTGTFAVSADTAAYNPIAIS